MTSFFYTKLPNLPMTSLEIAAVAKALNVHPFFVVCCCPCGLQYPKLRLHKNLMAAKTQSEIASIFALAVVGLE